MDFILGVVLPFAIIGGLVWLGIVYWRHIRSFYRTASDQQLVDAYNSLFSEYTKDARSYPSLAGSKRPDLRAMSRELKRRKITRPGYTKPVTFDKWDRR